VHQSFALTLAGNGQCGGRQQVHALVGGTAALAKNSHAVQHHINVRDQGLPMRNIGMLLKPDFASRAARRRMWKAMINALRMTTTDDYFGTGGHQRRDRVPANESCTA